MYFIEIKTLPNERLHQMRNFIEKETSLNVSLHWMRVFNKYESLSRYRILQQMTFAIACDPIVILLSESDQAQIYEPN